MMKKQYYEPSILIATFKNADVLNASDGFVEGTEKDPFTRNPWEA